MEFKRQKTIISLQALNCQICVVHNLKKEACIYVMRSYVKSLVITNHPSYTSGLNVSTLLLAVAACFTNMCTNVFQIVRYSIPASELPYRHGALMVVNYSLACFPC